MKNKTKLVLMTCLALAACTGCVGKALDKLGVEHDGLIEELIEKGIESGTGLSGDLTPESPE